MINLKIIINNQYFQINFFNQELIFNLKKKKKKMVEPLLSGIVLGLIPVTLSGLFVTAYLQYRRGDQLNL